MGESDSAYTKQHVVWAFFVGLVVGLGAYYVWTNKDGPTVKQNGDAAYSEEGGNRDADAKVMESKNSVTVGDQFAGFTVTVDKAALDKDGWVVIEEDVDGKPLYLLGASRRDAGSYENISVELLRNTEEGGTYYAVIYVDDGDKKFDHKIDLLATTADGNPVMDVFGVIRR